MHLLKNLHVCILTGESASALQVVFRTRRPSVQWSWRGGPVPPTRDMGLSIAACRPTTKQQGQIILHEGVCVFTFIPERGSDRNNNIQFYIPYGCLSFSGQWYFWQWDVNSRHEKFCLYRACVFLQIANKVNNYTGRLDSHGVYSTVVLR